MRIEDIRSEFAHLYKIGKYKENKDGSKVIEIPAASFIADEDTIFGKPNSYIERELQWYLSQSLNVHDIPGKTPPIWLDISDKDGNINSNYGWCAFSLENGLQFSAACRSLMNNINSRQALIIYQRPTMHVDSVKNGMKDFICTNAYQYLWNGESLDCIVQMRSNDCHFGYKNDRAWAKYLLDRMSTDLHVEAGVIHWQVGSLHCYERDFHLIEDYIHDS